jgi:integrase
MTKRGNGEGSITKRGDGRWMARVSLPSGRKTLYARTRVEVDAKLTAVKASAKDGAPNRFDRLSLRSFVRTWLEATRRTVRWGTWRKREMHMRLHVLPTLGHVALSRITTEQLEDLYAAKVDEGLSEQTVKHIHATIHCALEQAEERGRVLRNVARYAKPPKVESAEMTTWTEDEANHFLDALATSRWAGVFVLAITTAMRKSEILGLRWRDVDLDRAVVKLRTTIERLPRSEIRFVEPKTKRSRRKIDLIGLTVDQLRQQRVGQAAERLAAGSVWTNLDLVFATAAGQPVSESTLRREMLRLIALAGVPFIRFHDMRHTCITILLARGVPVKVVSELAGHSSVRVTLDTYSHVTPSMQREATLALEAAVGGKR